jgi:hypothetical protein
MAVAGDTGHAQTPCLYARLSPLRPVGEGVARSPYLGFCAEIRSIGHRCTCTPSLKVPLKFRLNPLLKCLDSAAARDGQQLCFP